MVPQPLNLHESSSSVSPVQPALDSSILPAQLHLCIFSLDLLMGFFLLATGSQALCPALFQQALLARRGESVHVSCFLPGKGALLR